MANIPISAFTAAANTTGIGMSGYSLTGSNAQSMLDLSGTWNTSGTPTGLRLNVTDTASNAASLLMDLQVGGVSQLNLSKAGRLRANDYAAVGDGDMLFYRSNLASLRIGTTVTTVAQSLGIGLGSNSASSPVVRLEADAANTLAQRNGVNAQTLRVYNTFTDASNYERGFVRWTGNRLGIGTEGLGTGSQRALDLQGLSVTVLIGGANAWFFYSNNHFGPAVDATQDIGTSSTRVRNLYMGSWIRMATTTVASLPAAATAGAGARMFVTDASAPTFGSAVVGGGAVTVPVYSTGSAWNVG